MLVLTRLHQTLRRLAVAVVAASALAVPASANTILISEINSNGLGGDFFELYNYGVAPVDLGNWRWVDNASAANGGPSFNGLRTYTFDSFTLQPGGVVLVVTDANGNSAGNDAFATSWGLSGVDFLTFDTGAGTGNGLGQNDLVALFTPDGNFLTGLNYSTAAIDITQGDLSIVPLDPFNLIVPPGGSSLGGHTGLAGAGSAAQQSLIWDPTSDPTDPLYTAASSVGLFGAFEHPSSAVTIGSPAVVPEPSSIGIVAAGLGLAAFGARRRMRKA